MPWLIEKMGDFLKDDDYIELNADTVVKDGWLKGLKAHRAAIEGHKQHKQDLILQAEQKIIKKELER